MTFHGCRYPHESLFLPLLADISVEIFEYLDADSLVRIRHTSSLGHKYVSVTLRRRVRRLFRNRLERYHAFLEWFTKHGCVISGEAALHVLFPANGIPSTIDIYVREGLVDSFVEYFPECESFVHIGSGQDENSGQGGDAAGSGVVAEGGRDQGGLPTGSAENQEYGDIDHGDLPAVSDIPVPHAPHSVEDDQDDDGSECPMPRGVIDTLYYCKDDLIIAVHRVKGANPLFAVTSQLHSGLLNYVTAPDVMIWSAV